MTVILIISVLAAVVLILLFSPFKIVITLNNSNTVLKYKLADVPLYKSRKKFIDYFKSTEEKVYAIDKQSLTLEKKFKLQYNFWKSILKLANKYLTIKNIKININFGTSDAASTAICSGVLWGAVYRILGVVGSIIPIEKNNVDIVPEYNNEIFSITGKCIIEGKFVHIIIIKLAYMIKNPKKKKRRKK